MRKSLSDALTQGNALVCFVTAGDPALDQLPAIISALNEGGANVIEVGIPFSDPIADGPTIQASSQRALDRGTRLDGVFSVLADIESAAPIVLMGYTNTALRLGFDSFAKRAAEAECSGVILSDLAPDDSEDWQQAAQRNGLDTIFLAAPTSTHARLHAVAQASTGFIYCVSRTGVTGADDSASEDIEATVTRVRQVSDLPVCVGFGISSHEHVRRVWKCAEGAIVGSYIVDLLGRTWNNGAGYKELISAVKALKGAL